MSFFAKLGEYEPCGMFGIEHFILLTLTVVGIIVALHFTAHKNKSEVKEIIKKCTLVLWVLEIIKIIFNLATGNAKNPNTYVPLYFCSLVLYAGLLSSFADGILKKVGDLFLATGGVVAGLVFIISPLTSLTNYPLFHFISVQSFVLHGIMIYIGLLINKTKYIEYDFKDMKYYFNFIVLFGVVALIVNKFLGTNLMFVSNNYPGTFIEIIYKMMGRFFSTFMIISQATLPYIFVMIVKKMMNKRNEKYIDENSVTLVR